MLIFSHKQSLRPLSYCAFLQKLLFTRSSDIVKSWQEWLRRSFGVSEGRASEASDAADTEALEGLDLPELVIGLLLAAVKNSSSKNKKSSS